MVNWQTCCRNNITIRQQRDKITLLYIPTVIEIAITLTKCEVPDCKYL